MSRSKKFRNEAFWKISILCLCLLQIGWKFPFGKHDPDKKIVTDQGVGYRQTSRSGKASDDIDKSYTIYGDVARLPNFKTPINEVPANITYKSKQDLSLVHPHTFQESVQDIEGAVFYDEVGNGWDQTFSLRGFSEGSAVVFLVDGVRVNELDGDTVNYPLLNMQDVQSVQIERGSASPVYGPGAFAGVVNITTGQASPKPVSLFGGFEISSHKGKNFYQGFSGTLQDKVTPFSGKWKYYFKGGRDIGDGFRGNSDYRITNFDIKTSYELPEEEGRIYFGWKHTEDLISNPGELTFDQYQQDLRHSNKPNDRRDFNNTILQFGGEKKFWDDRLMASFMTSWRWNLLHFITTSGTFTDWVTGSDPDTDRVTQKSRTTDSIWQLAYQETWRWIHNQVLLGMEFRNASEHSESVDAFGGEITPNFGPQTDRSSTPSDIALFWRETVKFFEKVIFHVGMRHDFFSLRTRDVLTPTDNISRRWRDSTISTGLTVKPLKFADLFANYSQGFRIPTLSELAGFGTINPNLQPERSDSYEIGTRLRYKDKAVLKFSYFIIDMKDEIVFDSSSITAANPFGQNTNIGKSRRTGIELGTEIQPIQELKLYGTYTWTRAYVRETDGGGSLVDGRALGQIPANRMTWGAHLWPLKRLGEPFDGLRVSMSGIFTGAQHPTAYESTAQATLDATGGAGHKIKPSTVWNFMLSYFWRGSEIYFKINNIFDERYYSRAVDATSWGTSIYPFGTYTFVNPGPPREFVGGIRWEF